MRRTSPEAHFEATKQLVMARLQAKKEAAIALQEGRLDGRCRHCGHLLLARGIWEMVREIWRRIWGKR